MNPNNLGDDDTTSPAEYGPVDTDGAHILEPPRTTRCHWCLLSLRVGLGEYRGSDEGGSVPEPLTGRHYFVAVMAVAITRRVGTQNLQEFPEPIDEGVVEVEQSLDGIRCVVNLLVLGVAEAAFWPWVMAFFDDL